MARPSTRQELIDYCLRTLGAPVLEINVDDDQIEDRIDEALQFYQEYHSDAIIKVYYKHQITSSDVTNKYVILPDSITTVQRILPMGDNSKINMFDARYQMSLNDVYNLRGGGIGDLSYYAQIQSYRTTLDMMFNGADQVRFNRHMNRLHIDCEWGVDLKENDYIVVDAFEIIDPQTFTDVYNDMFLKRYATALIKRQWGQNLSKFEGMQLPGGVTINAQRILDEAKEEILKTEEEMQLKYEMPPMFYMG
jgi:hypothetical protein